jgi:hypothetical protein
MSVLVFFFSVYISPSNLMVDSESGFFVACVAETANEMKHTTAR